MTSINKIKPDVEVKRQETNLTAAQKKNMETTKEGVVVNSLIKDPQQNINYLYNSMVISDNVELPQKIYENKNRENKTLLPISLLATGVMTTMALITFLVKRNLQASLKLIPEHTLPSMTRNVAVNQETHQAIYQMVQCPNQKTILAGVGVITISAMGFMGKMFMDGFKDVWVRKREADIQKNLQESLIAVETQSFSGKMQIMRKMLSDKAAEFSEYLCTKPENCCHPAFREFNTKVNFAGGGSKNHRESEDSNNLTYFGLGLLTVLAIAGLGFAALRNLTAGKKCLEDYIKVSKGKISEIVSNSKPETKESDKTTLKTMLQAIDVDAQYIKDTLEKLHWDEKERAEFIKEITFDTQKSTAKAEKTFGGDGTPKPTFYSHVNDYRAFLYNYLLDTSNPLFRNLFLGITGITALSYGGKVVGEAMKDVQVKTMNAQTELDLQKRLVSTELRNFKAKKDSVIEPLCDEFYKQLGNGKSKDELNTIAENILYEVKNGPPFVYS